MEHAITHETRHLSGFKTWIRLLKAASKSWMAANPFRQSAVIAYYAIFSFPALLVIAIAIAGLVFGHDAVSLKVYDDIESTMGKTTAHDVQLMIQKAGNYKNSILAIIIGIGTLIFGSIGVFEELHTSLNVIWQVRVKTDISIWKKLQMKLFSFGLVISIGFLLLVSLILTSFITALSHWIRSHFPDVLLVLLRFADIIISLSLITFLFSLMFKMLPDAKIKTRYVWKGALLTTLLFLIGKFALGIYFGKADPGSAYGAAGSIVLILLWVNYSSLILFFGAEFTKQYALWSGENIEPGKNGEKMPKDCLVE